MALALVFDFHWRWRLSLNLWTFIIRFFTFNEWPMLNGFGDDSSSLQVQHSFQHFPISHSPISECHPKKENKNKNKNTKKPLKMKWCFFDYYLLYLLTLSLIAYKTLWYIQVTNEWCVCINRSIWSEWTAMNKTNENYY